MATEAAFSSSDTDPDMPDMQPASALSHATAGFTWRVVEAAYVHRQELRNAVRAMNYAWN